MPRTRIPSLVVCQFLALFCTACTWSETEVKYTSTARMRPTGLIKVIPIKPLVGPDYPATTLVDPVAQKLTLPPFPDKQTVWFALELSGWGPQGLKGFFAQLTRVDAICPRAPCGCMTSANFTPCDPAVPSDCADGSACSSGACANAFFNKNDTTFVFYGKDHSPSVTQYDPTYTYYITLTKKGDVQSDIGSPVIGGYLAVSATDGCPDGPSTGVQFDSSALPFFELGDGTIVYPTFSGATIFFE